MGFPPLVRDRLVRLGLGRRVTRADLEVVCGGLSAANHFIDKSSKEGLLVPVAWGLYQVADQETLGFLSEVADPALRRLVSWARILPGLAKSPVAFLSPVLSKRSDLAVEEPMPILGLAPDVRTIARPTAHWGAFLMDLDPTEAWSLHVGSRPAATIHVPSPLDAQLLVQANADPRWRATAASWRGKLNKDAREIVNQRLSTLRRIPAPAPSLPIQLGPGPPARKRLVTPAWYERMHHEGLELIARGLLA